MSGDKPRTLHWLLEGPFVGAIGTLPRRGSPSAIAKEPAVGTVRLSAEGLQGDRQADPRAHGGPDRALCHGENLGGDRGPDETEVCIGDVLRLGSAVIQITQARAPCWKIEDRTGIEGLARALAESGRTGWLCRVREPGEVPPAPALELLERPLPAWSVRRAWEVYRGREDADAQAELAELTPLARAWREALTQRPMAPSGTSTMRPPSLRRRQDRTRAPQR